MKNNEKQKKKNDTLDSLLLFSYYVTDAIKKLEWHLLVVLILLKL